MKHAILPLVILSTFVVGCSSNKNTVPEVAKNTTSNVPSWVYKPVIEDGLASVSCVNSVGKRSMDQRRAVAAGRAELANQLKTQAANLHESFERMSEANGKVVTGAVSEDVISTFADETLVGSRAIEFAYIEESGQKEFCTLVTLSANLHDELFNKVKKATGATVSAEDEAILYEEFRAQRALDKLEATRQKHKKS